MAFGLGFGIGFCRRFGAAASDPGTIEGTPVSIAQGVEGETLADVVTWGSMTATVGTLEAPVQEMRLNAGSWATYVGTTALVHPDEWDVRETFTSTTGATRTDTDGPMTVVGAPASAPAIISHADTIVTDLTETSVNMPPTYAAGDVLLAEVTIDGNITATHGADWTLVQNEVLSGSYRKLTLTKTAAGSDVLTIDHGGVPERSACKTVALSAGAVLTFGPLTVGGDAAALDMVTSSGTLWLVTATHSGAAAHVGTGSAPTGYTFVGDVVQSAAATSGSAVHIAQKVATSSLENPDAFSAATASLFRSQVIAVRF